MPDLIETVKISVADLIAQGHIPGIDQYVDQGELRVVVNYAIERMVESTIDGLVLDPNWIAKIENQIKQNLAQSVIEHLRTINVAQAIKDQIDANIEDYRSKLLENFSSRGIQDFATETRLTVTDDGVVSDRGLAALELLIEQDAHIRGTLVADKLVITRGMNTDSPGWLPLIDNISARTLEKIDADWRENLVQQVLDLAKSRGINFNQISIDGSLLIEGDTLSRSIKNTSIEKLGVLRELRVNGPVNLGDSVTVVNRRLGINTETPEMALSVWDEEVSLIAGKLSSDQAYIGSGRNQSLTIGINRVPQIEISSQGLTTIRQLCVGRHRIGHADQVPGWSGTKGDIVFNSSPDLDSPFAWQCLGGYQWRPVGA